VLELAVDLQWLVFVSQVWMSMMVSKLMLALELELVL
jgi:hypothetical protein